MVSVRLTRLETQQLVLWGRMAEGRALDVGVPFEPDEVRLLEKLRDAVDRSPGPEPARPIGRPRIVTPELAARALELRGSGAQRLTWAKVGASLHLSPETCRKAVRSLRSTESAGARGGKTPSGNLDRPS